MQSERKLPPINLGLNLSKINLKAISSSRTSAEAEASLEITVEGKHTNSSININETNHEFEKRKSTLVHADETTLESNITPT